MQIIQWFQKVAREPAKECHRVNTSISTNKKEGCSDKSKEIQLSNHQGANQRQKRARNISSGCDNFHLFTILRRRDIGKCSFYNTLNLRRIDTMKMMKKEDIARGLGITNNKTTDLVANHVGNTKVLPITDVAISSGTNQCGDKEKSDKSEKSKTLSKMKELLRWAAAAKSEKGGKYISRKVLQFRNRRALKSVPDDEQLSNDSPKTSFRWDMESCTTTSSVYSALSKASSKRISVDQNTNIPPLNSTPIHDDDHITTTKSGKWITTDSDFVVLEL